MPPAAKFTRSGTITVTGGISENGKHIFLAVEDTGVGIPKDKFGQIFGAFKQVWGGSVKLWMPGQGGCGRGHPQGQVRSDLWGF